MNFVITTLLSLCHLTWVKSNEDFGDAVTDTNYLDEASKTTEVFEDATENAIFWNTIDFSEFYDYYVSNGNNFMDRENRRNEFIPFNSLTFKEGGAANAKFKDKIKDKNKKINKNKFEWWKKQNKDKVKDNKKKNKNKNKGYYPPIRTTRTTTSKPKSTRSTSTPAPAPTSVATWFPKSSPTTTNYFSRPLDYQKPLQTVWWDKKGNIISVGLMLSKFKIRSDIFTLINGYFFQQVAVARVTLKMRSIQTKLAKM